MGVDLLIAEAVAIEEGDEGDEWGPAVEALARYLHAHADLRAFLEEQRRSTEPMSWVNLACQHLPITATARQKLLEASALERCLKISRGLDALLRKEARRLEPEAGQRLSRRRLYGPSCSSTYTNDPRVLGSFVVAPP